MGAISETLNDFVLMGLGLGLECRPSGPDHRADDKLGHEAGRMKNAGAWSKRHGLLQLSVSVLVTSIPGISDYPPVPCPRPVS